MVYLRAKSKSVKSYADADVVQDGCRRKTLAKGRGFARREGIKNFFSGGQTWGAAQSRSRKRQAGEAKLFNRVCRGETV